MVSNRIRDELQLMLKDLDKQECFYKPTAFWEKASRQLVQELEENGLESFRAGGFSRDFFVPTYGAPGNTLSEEFISALKVEAIKTYGEDSKAHMTLMRELNGEAWAHSDYRTFVAGDRVEVAPDLSNVSETKVGNPKEHFNFDGRYFSRSFLNYLLGLVFLKINVPTGSIKKVIEIVLP